MTRKMQSGKIIILLGLAVALFALLQVVESNDIEDKAKAIEKKIDDDFKKMSKRAADDDDDGGKHKKGKKRKGSSTTTAPGDSKSSTTPAPASKSTTKAAAGGSTTTTTKAPASGSTTAAPSKSSTTGHPDDPKGGSTTTASPKSSSTTTKKGGDPAVKDEDEVNKARDKQSKERDIIRKIFKETSNWKKWLEENERKTLNPKAAKATWDISDKVKQMVLIKPKRFYGLPSNNYW